MKTTYTPHPLDTSDIILPESITSLVEQLAKNNHDTWAQERINQSWSYGPQRNDILKEHPCLVPYEMLSEEERAYDINTAVSVLKHIIKLGYRIEKDNSAFDAFDIEDNVLMDYHGTNSIVMIPDTASTIVSHALEGNDVIRQVTIPGSVKTIGKDAFGFCSQLTNVTLLEGVEEIGSDAFEVCENLSKISIPNTVTYIGQGAFFGCSALKSVRLPESFYEISSCLFTKSGLTSIEIPDGVEAIGEYAFSDCADLKTIRIPASVTYIDDTAFENGDTVLLVDEGSYALKYAMRKMRRYIILNH